MTTTITKSVLLNASRETVWAFLTNKDKLGEWYHPAEADLADGEVYSLYRMDENNKKEVQITGRVLEMNPPSRLVTTFVIGPFQGKETTVKWVLEEVAEGTRLSLTHEGIAEAAGDAAMHLFSALDNGWDTHLSELHKSVG